VKKGPLTDPDSFRDLNLVIALFLLPLGITLSLTHSYCDHRRNFSIDFICEKSTTTPLVLIILKTKVRD
ncbi:MAG: hypothetical protein ACFFBQ_05635, partial [Promethearchaeota archaeon]